jgi:hypothetical protein
VNEAEWTAQTRRLNLNFPGQERRPESLASWFDEGQLGQYPQFLISLAVTRIIRASEYPPRSVVELVRVIEDVRGEMAREQAEDATRTCPGCCTELIPGWIEAEDGWHPCGDCRPGRHEALVLTRKSGWPDSRTGRNHMVAPWDKDTGCPKGKELSA